MREARPAAAFPPSAASLGMTPRAGVLLELTIMLLSQEGITTDTLEDALPRLLRCLARTLWEPSASVR